MVERAVLPAQTYAGDLSGRGLDDLADHLAGAPSEEAYWRRFRESQFLIQPPRLYLDCGRFGLTARAVLDETFRWRVKLEQETERAAQEDGGIERVRQRLARFLGCSGDDLVFTRNVTEGFSLVANGIGLRAGETVLGLAYGHPAETKPWELACARAGARFAQLDVPHPPSGREEIVEHFRHALDSLPNVRLFTFSHVLSHTHLVLPVQELCRLARERGVLTLVDGAQAVGMLTFRIADLECDFYAMSFHKWFFGPKGTGALYVRRLFGDRLHPLQGGNAYYGRTPLAARLEGLGTIDLAPVLALEAAVGLHELLGPERVQHRGRVLRAEMAGRLAERGYRELANPVPFEESTHAVALRTPSGVDAIALVERLREEHQLWTRGYSAYGVGLRISTAVCNLEAEIERGSEIIADALDGARARTPV